jgi:hypothetical protein
MRLCRSRMERFREIRLVVMVGGRGTGRWRLFECCRDMARFSQDVQCQANEEEDEQ